MSREQLILAILDGAKGTRIGHYFKLFSSSLKWNREELERYRLQRLKQLLATAERSTPYYRSLFKAAGFKASQLKKMSDMENIPILERDTIRERVHDLNVAGTPKTRLFRSSSSGTTGIPITYYHDIDGLSAGTAAGYTLWAMSGWRLGQRNVHIWGNATSIQRWRSWSSRAKNALLRQLNVPSTGLDDPKMVEAAAQKIIAHDPISIDGYPGAIFTLAQHFQARGYSLRNLKHVLTTAENLEDQQRKLIEEVFAPTGDLYGSGEVLGIATRPVADDKYYIFEPHVVVEAVPSGLPGMKDILVTDLDNQGMPFIRYRVGDMIDDLHLPDGDSRFPLAFFKQLMGRRSDIIRLPNGKRFHPVNIFGGTLFRKFPGITRHKVAWNGTSLKFVFERRSLMDEDKLKDEIGQLIAEYQVSYSIEFTDKMPIPPGGKHTYLEILEPGEGH
ncbi:MAG: hypothetical protein MUO31_10890 [Thermodesulfovibrionales bacterium]|nr:hypothetical protein [Thermodesulfovibrionales bacterium]